MTFGLGSAEWGNAWLSVVNDIVEKKSCRLLIEVYAGAGDLERRAFLASLVRRGVGLMGGEPDAQQAGFLTFDAIQPPGGSDARWRETFRRADCNIARACMDLPLPRDTLAFRV